MEWLVFCVLVFGTLAKAQNCPGRCICQTISPTLLCAKTGLLFVPPTIDRKTVELRLTDNFITVIRRKDFLNMTSLVHLTLSRNTISQIAPQAFAGLRALRALHMDSNRLTVIKSEHLKGLMNLRHLILGNNQIHSIAPTCFDEFVSTIEDLDLSYNNLRTLPWDAIGRMTNINTLSLDHNLIDYIKAGTFTMLTKLVRLDMTSNRLHKLPPDNLFQNAQISSDPRNPANPAKLAVSFGGNPLHCNCELLWLRRLTREDDLETCASPDHLMDKYFWSIQEEEFNCVAPLITKHAVSNPYVMEGQGVALKCKAQGDPDPDIHWRFPDGKLVHNNSRTIVHDNGTLEILITTLKDNGAFTCVASNAAGMVTATVEIGMIPLPLFVNNTAHMREMSGVSDITISKSNDTKSQDKRVVVADVTSSSAVIRWPSERHIPNIRMYQIQYNSSADDTLVYRMIPSTSKTFLINDLAGGREYDLCVLAVYDDGIRLLTATRVVGCVQFHTMAETSQCRFIHSQFLGGTMIIIIGGIIVASVLVFIIILMIRYKAHGGPDGAKPKGSGSGSGSGSSSTVHLHTNGSGEGRSQGGGGGASGGRMCRSVSKQQSVAPLTEESRCLEGHPSSSSMARDCKALVLKLESGGGGGHGDSAVLEVDLPSFSAMEKTAKAAVEALARRASLDAQQLYGGGSGALGGSGAGTFSEDTGTDSSLTGSTMSLCLIGHSGGGGGAGGGGGGGKDSRKGGALANMGLLPSELARTRHRFSFDGDYALFQSHSYPRRARTRRHKSSNQINVDSSPLANRKVTFSSTEWMLESTV